MFILRFNTLDQGREEKKNVKVIIVHEKVMV